MASGEPQARRDAVFTARAWHLIWRSHPKTRVTRLYAKLHNAASDTAALCQAGKK